MASSLQKPGVIPIHNVASNSQTRFFIQTFSIGNKHFHSQFNFKRTLVVSCAKTAEPQASLDSFRNESLEKKHATFPNGFEALVLDVCDETQIAELKVKVGEFEMHLKRNIEATEFPLSNISPTTPPPVPTEPMVESAPATPPLKSSAEKTKPFVNVAKEKSQKLAALEASGTNNYVLVPSPTVGSFRSGRTIKGKKQPPVCKETNAARAVAEATKTRYCCCNVGCGPQFRTMPCRVGDVIKEGQVIGYLDQFGTSLPVKSDVAGEVLKLLFQDGDAVGYGDPLIAVLPSFHNINIK